MGHKSTRSGDQASSPGRPYWLFDSCPAWCVDKGQHENGEPVDLRVHSSEGRSIDLTTEDTVKDARVVGNQLQERNSDIPSTLDICLEQHYLHAWARIRLGRDGTAEGFYLTLAEAEHLRTELDLMVTDAYEARNEAQNPTKGLSLIEQARLLKAEVEEQTVDPTDVSERLTGIIAQLAMKESDTGIQ